MQKIIAIDGHSSTGKSSLSKRVAQELGFIHIDTGAMYRAITWYALQNNFFEKDNLNVAQLIQNLNQIFLDFKINPDTNKNEIYLNGKNIESEIRTMQVSEKVSSLAKIEEVRSFLVQKQRELAQEVGIVMDGRDIGTVVFPDAPVKIFLTASPEVRVQRRYDELINKGEMVTQEEVRKNIMQRDLMDESRNNSPLIKAKDAVVINNDKLNAEQTFAAVIDVIQQKMS